MSVSPFLLLFPPPFSYLSWNMDSKSSACLFRALCQKMEQVKLLKRIKKDCSLAKWGKQMFRGGFAVSSCVLAAETLSLQAD